MCARKQSKWIIAFARWQWQKWINVSIHTAFFFHNIQQRVRARARTRKQSGWEWERERELIRKRKIASSNFVVNKYKCTFQLVYSKIFYSIFFCTYANTHTRARVYIRDDSCYTVNYMLWLFQSKFLCMMRWDELTRSPTHLRAFSYFSSQCLSSRSLNFIDELYLSWIKWFVLIDFISLMRI